MPLGGPGPRDWSPPGYFADAPSGPPPRRPRSAFLTAEPPRGARRATRPWAWATLAMFLGLGSLVMALAEPQEAGVQSGFIASTIGVTAIVIGRRLVTDRSRFGSVARAFGRGAIMLGTVGTALMAYAVLAFGLSTVGVQWPVLSLPASHEGQVFDPGFPMAVSSPDAVPAAPATEDQVPAEAAPEPAAAGDSTEQGAAPARPRRLHRRRPRFPSRRASTPSGPRSPWAPGPWRTPGGTVRSRELPDRAHDGERPGADRPDGRNGAGADPGGRAGPVLGRAGSERMVGHDHRGAVRRDRQLQLGGRHRPGRLIVVALRRQRGGSTSSMNRESRDNPLIDGGNPVVSAGE